MLLFLLPLVSSERLGRLGWGRANGVYIHPCVEYRNAGMFATCTIEPNVDLVRVPKGLLLPSNNDPPMHVELVDRLMDFPEDHVLSPFVASLPVECQLPMCKPIDFREVTNYGARKISSFASRFADWSERRRVVWSVAVSRMWSFGMVPVAELFNHDVRGRRLGIDENEYIVINGPRTEAGQELFINYGSLSVWDTYNEYGFLSVAEPSCEDLRSLRLQTQGRAECIANDTWTFSEAVDELLTAAQHDDVSMLRGIGRWLDSVDRVDMASIYVDDFCKK